MDITTFSTITLFSCLHDNLSSARSAIPSTLRCLQRAEFTRPALLQDDLIFSLSHFWEGTTVFMDFHFARLTQPSMKSPLIPLFTSSLRCRFSVSCLRASSGVTTSNSFLPAVASTGLFPVPFLFAELGPAIAGSFTYESYLQKS
jgi:hypothetical protein